MGSPIAGMLMEQPAQAGIADSSLSNLSPEAQALIKQLASQGGIPPAAPPEAAAQPPQSPQPQGGGIMEMLKGLFSRMMPSTASLAPPPTQQAALPPEQLAQQLAERNRLFAGGR